ncbi:hypothetical protein TcWFU_007329 [Taenia crassiceps]|uniref:PDZ domain-containing protein n=1 Tax=Taenia crassiceps TaxID=6207 RepID=A0ABR4Q7R5_9CEST
MLVCLGITYFLDCTFRPFERENVGDTLFCISLISNVRRAVDLLKKLHESDLFNALIDINEYYREMLGVCPHENKSETRAQRNDFSPAADSASKHPIRHEDVTSLGEPSDWEYVEVVISRPSGENVSFGFSIAGGHDAPQENGDPCIYVTRIAPGSIAEANGRLRPFDQIISVNGSDLTCVSNQEAVRILRESGDTLAMIIRRYSGPEAVPSDGALDSPVANGISPDISNDEDTANEDMYYEVSLLKPSESVGLGFTIAGGQAYEGYPCGIYVTKITPGGLAEKDGQIQPGDRLLQVNGQELDNVTHDAAVQLLRNAGTHVHLVLLRSQEFTASLNFASTPTSDYTIDGNK